MLNQCNFIGRLGKSPETRYTASGDAVTSFSIACSEQWKDKSGQKQEKTEWVNCTTFGKLAEICGKYLDKGSLVYISGKMQTDKYQDKQTGQDRYSTKINVREMKMLGSSGEAKSHASSHGASNADGGQQSPQPAPNQFDDDFEGTEGIPF